MTERYSGAQEVEGTQDVHASTEPGWEALAGETVRSDALLHRVARPGANRPRLGGHQRVQQRPFGPTSALGLAACLHPTQLVRSS